MTRDASAGPPARLEDELVASARAYLLLRTALEDLARIDAPADAIRSAIERVHDVASRHALALTYTVAQLEVLRELPDRVAEVEPSLWEMEPFIRRLAQSFVLLGGIESAANATKLPILDSGAVEAVVRVWEEAAGV